MSSDTAVLDEPKAKTKAATRAKPGRAAAPTATPKARTNGKAVEPIAAVTTGKATPTPKARTGPRATRMATDEPTYEANRKATAARATRFKAAQEAANLLKQVGDPTRFLVIRMLAEGEMHVGALCGQLDQSQPAVSHHLAILRHSGIIAPRRQGKMNFYALTSKGRELAEVVQTVMGTKAV